MQPWHCLALGLVWLGVSGAFTACKHKDTQADIPSDTSVARLAPVVHLSPLEKDVVQEINLARTQPKAYAAFLEQLRPNYVSGRGQSPGAMTIITKGGKSTFVTAEGPQATRARSFASAAVSVLTARAAGRRRSGARCAAVRCGSTTPGDRSRAS